MRASLGNGRLRPWQRVAAVTTTAMLALSIVAGGTAVAATPGWTVGYGTDSFASPPATTGASSTSVSAGNEVGFFEWLRNDGTSNISQLYLTATSSPTASVFGAQWSIKDNLGGLIRSGTCPTTTPLNCSFGALNPTQTVYVVVAFNVPANMSDGSTLDVEFLWNSTGTPPGKNKSHGDATTLTDSVIVTDNGDAAGDFNFDQPAITVANNQKTTGKNQQATLLSVSGVLTGVAVNDSPTLEPATCNDEVIAEIQVEFPWFSCDLLTSLTSVVEVGNGKSFSNQNGAGTPGIKVIVSFAQAPNQLSGDTPFVYHYWEDGTGAHAELITDACTYANGFPTNLGPCLTVGNKQATVWLLHNGGMRF